MDVVMCSYICSSAFKFLFYNEHARNISSFIALFNQGFFWVGTAFKILLLA